MKYWKLHESHHTRKLLICWINSILCKSLRSHQIINLYLRGNWSIFKYSYIYLINYPMIILFAIYFYSLFENILQNLFLQHFICWNFVFLLYSALLPFLDLYQYQYVATPLTYILRGLALLSRYLVIYCAGILIKLSFMDICWPFRLSHFLLVILSQSFILL